MSEQPKGFTVNDRRHFAPDGSLRDAAPGPSAAAGPEATADPAGAVDFGGFLVSLAAQAGSMLDPGPEAGAEPRSPDLAGARQIIAILEMLKDKTEGRRTPQEDELLAGLLYELRMAWLARSRGVVA